ncbi:transmembrane protein 116-like [Lingula anatina]|uniref:Transmembrane protein 116-like n=1 Tax=Lingula anatina TaxID=7574 RepID=A0A1S3HQT7_LINAN|nr:transmembrane protein 116-like [Lingula anatina]|eukprot:XP_013388418.1 transmembrane protein 116-like [Lingula anatina]
MASMSSNSSLDIYMLTEEHMKVVGCIDLAMSLLSLLGAGSILVYAGIKKKICIPEVYPIFHLSLADCLASLCLLLGATMYLTHEHTMVMSACHYIVGAAVCFYIITFLLTMTYAVEVYNKMKRELSARENSTGRKARKKCNVLHPLYIMSWAVPLLVAFAFMLVTRREEDDWYSILPPATGCEACLPLFHYNDDLCMSQKTDVEGWEKAMKYLFLGPLTLTMLVNFVIYVLIIRAFRQIQMTRGVLSYQQHKVERQVKVKAMRYQLVFFFCWIPSLVLGVFSISSKFDMNQYFWLYVLQGLTAPLQGFFNSLVYGWNRDGFKRAITEPFLKHAAPSTSYSSVSL